MAQERLRFGNSLKFRIALVAGLLFLAGIGLIAAFVTRILHGDMQEMLSNQQLASAVYIARDIDAKVALRLESLQRVAQNMPAELFADRTAMQSWLEDRKAIHTLFPTGLMVIPPDGGPTLGDAPRLASRPRSFTDRDWYICAIKRRQACISKPLIARATGQPALVIAIPVIDRNDRLLGILAGVTPLAIPGFLDLILGARPGKHGAYQLISPQHDLFALTSDVAVAIKPLPLPGLDPALDLARNGQRGVQIVRDAQGKEELIAIAAIPRADWLLISRQPADEAFAPVANTLRNILLITALLALPIVIALLATLNRLLQPLARLAGELHAMADGSRPMQAVTTHSSDEVADVAHSFNRLQSRLREQEQRLEAMVHRDTLTGLPNRRLIDERLYGELHRPRQPGDGLALLFLDIDGFKQVNDRHGHPVGDLVLIEIARRLQSCVRDRDTLARLGGDEFLILLAETRSPLEAAERVAQQCITRLAQPIDIDGLVIGIGVSIGIAIEQDAPESEDIIRNLINRADRAMYKAKAEGRNRYIVADSPISPQTPEHTPS